MDSSANTAELLRSAPKSAMPTVLVVDDDPVLRELFDAVLRTEGVTQIYRASDGNEARDQLANHPDIDFVTLDLNMPGCDGVAFMRLARQMNYAGRLVLISSEHEAVRKSAGRLASLLELDCTAVLPKPVDFARVAQLLSEQEPAVPKPPQPKVDLEIVRESLETGRLEAFYQPRVDIQCNRLAGAEALARIRNDRGEILNTEDAINLAEEHGLIEGLTWRIAETVVADYASIRRQIPHSVHVSFNVSTAVLSRQGFADRFLQLVRDYGHEPRSFTLEVTETRLPSDRSIALEQLTRARIHGFGIAVDDFGTGHSNIAQMRDYPFTELKIDKEFLLNAYRDRFSRAAVEAGAALARELGLMIIAEGVETTEALEFARQCGINEGQGYLFARPLPLGEFLVRAGELSDNPEFGG